ncbi:hypothetical protein AM571_PC01966 (plasmid) [Rhizobium etli 8C-3]|uniref:Uncharacterized protein n=1 Tax=Rhizobium etli 8C-3 TaxID=538025 RepID=A0A1L5PIE2_RHIET|nr:hypothetical protein AM571_PC01966 [Rhizobium etli 8C-3]
MGKPSAAFPRDWGVLVKRQRLVVFPAAIGRDIQAEARRRWQSPHRSQLAARQHSALSCRSVVHIMILIMVLSESSGDQSAQFPVANRHSSQLAQVVLSVPFIPSG